MIAHIYCGNGFDTLPYIMACRNRGVELLEKHDNLKNLTLNLRNLNHVGMIIIDYMSTECSQDGILSLIRLFAGGKVVVTTNEDTPTEVIDGLRGSGFTNIITPSVDPEEALGKIIDGDYSPPAQDAAAPQTNTAKPKRGKKTEKDKPEKVKTEKAKPEKPRQPAPEPTTQPEEPRAYSGKRLRIAFAGATHGCGTTHHALALAVYLRGKGLNSCYAQPASTDTADSYGIWTDIYKEAKNGCRYLDFLPVFSGELPDIDGFDAVIEDYGLPDGFTSSFDSADIKVIVSTCKPKSLTAVYSLYNAFALKSGTILLLNLASRNERLDLKELFAKSNVLFAEFEPDIFNGTANAETYDKILEAGGM